MGKMFRAVASMPPRVPALLRMHPSMPVEGGDSGPDLRCPAWDLHTHTHARTHKHAHTYAHSYSVLALRRYLSFRGLSFSALGVALS